MAKLRDYTCDCGNRFEHTFLLTTDEATLPDCPACGVTVTEDDEMFGGRVFETIIPMHRTSLKNKAGYVHKYNEGRPAEKSSIAVPRNKGEF